MFVPPSIRLVVEAMSNLAHPPPRYVKRVGRPSRVLQEPAGLAELVVGVPRGRVRPNPPRDGTMAFVQCKCGLRSDVLCVGASSS